MSLMAEKVTWKEQDGAPYTEIEVRISRNCIEETNALLNRTAYTQQKRSDSIHLFFGAPLFPSLLVTPFQNKARWYVRLLLTRYRFSRL